MTYGVIPFTATEPADGFFRVTFGDLPVVALPRDKAEAVAALLNDLDAEYPKWLNPVERKIITALLDTALADPAISIRVYDGEEFSTEWTRDRRAIEREIAATDATSLYFHKPESKAWVLLIHGNLEDVISDYTDNEFTNALVAPALKVAGQEVEDTGE